MNIRCIHCGNYYPEQEYVCPQCGTVPNIFICPECDALVDVADESCIYCGAVLDEKPVCAQKDALEKEYGLLCNELKQEDLSSTDLKAIRKSLLLISKYIDTDQEILQINEQLMQKVMEELNEDLSANAKLLKEDENSIPAHQLSKLLRALHAQGNEEELVEQFQSKAEAIRAAMKRRVILAACGIGTIAILLLGGICIKSWILPAAHYSAGNRSFNAGNYEAALQEYLSCIEWKDASEKAEQASFGVHYNAGVMAIAVGDYNLAQEELLASHGFQDAAERICSAQYLSAQALKKAGQTVEAAKIFAKLETYSDSEQQVMNCAQTLVDSGKFSEAQTIYSLLNNAEAKNMALYCQGMDAFENGEDSKAIAALEKTTGISGVETILHQAMFRKAERAFASGDYVTATSLFQQLSSDPEAAEKAVISLFYEAETDYAAGKLNQAKKCYLSLPQGYERDGISVPSRINAIDAKSVYLNLCGVWTTESAVQYTVKKVDLTNGVWTARGGKAENLKCTIGCVILENGRLHLQGEIQYYRFTSYEKEKSEEVLCTVPIDQDIITMPYSFMADESVKVTIAPNSVTLVFSEKATPYEEWYFYDQYETECVYDQKLEEY